MSSWWSCGGGGWWSSGGWWSRPLGSFKGIKNHRRMLLHELYCAGERLGAAEKLIRNAQDVDALSEGVQRLEQALEDQKKQTHKIWLLDNRHKIVFDSPSRPDHNLTPIEQ